MPALRIVAIDFDAQIGKRLGAAFAPPEFEFRWFAAGREALEALPDLQPDAIVCELLLPDVDGRAVLDAVKRSPGLRHVPFLVLSGVRSQATIRATLDAGAEAFLLKPFPVSKLVQTIRGLLGNETPDHSGERTRDGWGTSPGHDAVNAVGRSGLDWAFGPSDAGTAAHDAAGRQRIGFNTRDPLPPAPRAEASSASPTSQQPVRTLEAAGPQLQGPESPEAAPPIRLEGRISTLDLDGARVRVITEAEPGKGLVLRTTVVRNGNELRRIETNLDHLLESGEDHRSLKDLIEVQHAVILQEIRRPAVSLFPPQAEPPPADGALAASTSELGGQMPEPAPADPARPPKPRPRTRRRATRQGSLSLGPPVLERPVEPGTLADPGDPSASAPVAKRKPALP